MSDPFIGEIAMFAGDYAPRGWMFCDGQLLPIKMHSELFAILGTTYGGDGRTTFALPDLRGRTPIHAGTGPELTQRPLGMHAGQELGSGQIPSHAHAAHAAAWPASDGWGLEDWDGWVDIYAGDTPDSNDPEGAYLATLKSDWKGNPISTKGYSFATSGETLNTGSAQLSLDELKAEVMVGHTGEMFPNPHSNMQPCLTVNFIIALMGVFPFPSSQVEF